MVRDSWSWLWFGGEFSDMAARAVAGGCFWLEKPRRLKRMTLYDYIYRERRIDMGVKRDKENKEEIQL